MHNSNDVNLPRGCAENSPLVTVALPVLNGGSSLEHSVRSVLGQSWQNWELLLLDDGSTDGAVDRLPFLSDPRIVLIRDGLNRGLSARLNQAVSIAKGKYFARMDHDDLCHPERFAQQIAFLERHPRVDLLATQCVTMDELERLNGTLPSAISHQAICRYPWKGFYMPHPSWMGHIRWFRENPYKEPAPYCCEDQEVLLRAYTRSHYFTLPNRLLAYRVRSHAPFKRTLRTRYAMLKMQCGYFLLSRDWISFTLSIGMTSTRIIRDGLRELRYQLFPRAEACWGSRPSLEEQREWQIIIQSITERSGSAVR